MKKVMLGLAAGAALALQGCAPQIDYSEVSGNFAAYSPKSVAILPFTNSMGMEAANEAVNSIWTNQLTKSKKFERIAEPGQVKQSMMSNEALINLITSFRMKWVATGMADGKAAAEICKILNVDSIIFGEITQWASAQVGSDKVARCGLAFRWVESSKGEVLWKGTHIGQFKGDMLFSAIAGRDPLKKAAENVSMQIIAAWPGKV